MKQFLLLLAATVAACGRPPAASVFPTDRALGPFARDPSSPVIVRGGVGAPDELGATAPSVYLDAQGARHAIYLGLDGVGGSHLLGVDEIDAGVWRKQGTAVVATQGAVGRPAALLLQNQVTVFYDSLDANGQPLITSNLPGTATISGATKPCAVLVGGQVFIYALGADGTIHAFVSPDAMQPFSDKGSVLGPSREDGGFDAFAVSAPSVQVEQSALGRTLFRLWYAGTDQDGGTVSVGLSGSFDGLRFERYAENPVRFHADVPSVYPVADGGFAMLYAETPFSTPSDVSYAVGP